MRPYITYEARSDMGLARRNNEDNLFCNGVFLTEEKRGLPFKSAGKLQLPALFAVYDGMGGLQCGEQASFLAAESLSLFADKLLKAEAGHLDEYVREYVNEANRQIQRRKQQLSIEMGTTMALAVITADAIHAYNMGDSRIYGFDKSGLRQLSADHTLAMAHIQSGKLTKLQARQSREWNILTACLGFSDESGSAFEAEVLPPVELKAGMRILICSDGLTNMVPDVQIEYILRTRKNTDQAVMNLISEALNNGGKDNVTAVVIDVKPGRLLKLKRKSESFRSME